MAGYNGYSMSNNAISAYDNGLLPASKIKGIPSILVKKFCPYKEWHHSSKNYNKTYFYDPEEVYAIFGIKNDKNYGINHAAVAALKAYKNGDDDQIHDNCHVEWIDWTGTLKRPVANKMNADGCTVTVKGNTATITLPNGKTFKKRLTTKGFNFTKK